VHTVIDPHVWSAGAIAEAIHPIERDRAIGTGFAEFETGEAPRGLFELSPAYGLTGLGAADLHTGTTTCLQPEVMEKGDQPVNLCARDGE
jgi:hypothetical protein